MSTIININNNSIYTQKIDTLFRKQKKNIIMLSITTRYYTINNRLLDIG